MNFRNAPVSSGTAGLCGRRNSEAIAAHFAGVPARCPASLRGAARRTTARAVNLGISDESARNEAGWTDDPACAAGPTHKVATLLCSIRRACRNAARPGEGVRVSLQADRNSLPLDAV